MIIQKKCVSYKDFYKFFFILISNLLSKYKFKIDSKWQSGKAEISVYLKYEFGFLDIYRNTYTYKHTHDYST